MSTILKEILLSANPVEQLRDLSAANEGRETNRLYLLEPSLAELHMDIPSGYHHKDNLDHSLKVLQNAIDREVGGPDLILRTAALFHDVGKPATRAFGAKGVVSFTNHDFVGSKMIHRILENHDYSAEEIEQIAPLIRLHMRSHTFKAGWSESAVRRLSADAGSFEQLQRLIVIFYADTTTAIADKKNHIHSNVAALAAELERVQAKDIRGRCRPALNGVEVAELLGITPGPKLGEVMKFLNTDEIVFLSKQDAEAAVLSYFGK